MKKDLKYSALILLCSLLLFSCKKSTKEICDETIICYTSKPDKLYVELKLSKSASSKPVEILLFRDNYDNGKLLDQFFTNNEYESYLLSVDSKYTAAAKYVVDKDTIMVVDSERLGDGFFKNCDKSCYDWNDKITLDLRLKSK